MFIFFYAWSLQFVLCTFKRGRANPSSNPNKNQVHEFLKFEQAVVVVLELLQWLFFNVRTARHLVRVIHQKRNKGDPDLRAAINVAHRQLLKLVPAITYTRVCQLTHLNKREESRKNDNN